MSEWFFFLVQIVVNVHVAVFKYEIKFFSFGTIRDYIKKSNNGSMIKLFQDTYFSKSVARNSFIRPQEYCFFKGNKLIKLFIISFINYSVGTLSKCLQNIKPFIDFINFFFLLILIWFIQVLVKILLLLNFLLLFYILVNFIKNWILNFSIILARLKGLVDQWETMHRNLILCL